MHFVSHKVRINPIINDEYPNLKQETKLVYVHPIHTTKHKQTMAWDELNQDHSKSEVGSFKWPPNNPYSNGPKSTIHPLKTQIEQACTQNLLTPPQTLLKTSKKMWEPQINSNQWSQAPNRTIWTPKHQSPMPKIHHTSNTIQLFQKLQNRPKSLQQVTTSLKPFQSSQVSRVMLLKLSLMSHQSGIKPMQKRQRLTLQRRPQTKSKNEPRANPKIGSKP